MTFLHFLYNVLATGLAVVAWPLVWCHERRSPQRRRALAQRLAYDPALAKQPCSAPCIWIHAVSVGEVKASEAVIRELEAGGIQASILITTTTMTGQHLARSLFGGRVQVRYAPLDLWWTTRRFLAAHRPDLVVVMETEIWPNWIWQADAAGIPVVFLNGRISQRSIRSYLFVRPLLAACLARVTTFSMISAADARRIIQLGAPTDRVVVHGNAKMDVQTGPGDDQRQMQLKQRYGIQADQPVFVAGSVRGQETTVVVDAYRKMAETIPDLVCIIAPRHLENARRIADHATATGLAWQSRTDLDRPGIQRSAPLVILNTIGELRDVYGLAAVVFCGGSLVALGGQNVLEPAMWAKPILFGPSMEDFQEAARMLLASGGGITVTSGDDLAQKASALLADPQQARRLGEQARQAVRANQGAARRHADVIQRVLRSLPA